MNNLPGAWNLILASERNQPYFQELTTFVDVERKSHNVYPPTEDVYGALKLTPYENVRVVILGQDPYHGPGQAHGLCFSVGNGVRPPPSLVNIFKELKTDLGIDRPKTGTLIPWANQGVLLLNAVLTVRANTANSHKDKGWERFTDAILRAVNAKTCPVVFVLWGGYAQKKRSLIDETRHTVIASAHPSPLSAHNGFFGSRPFSKINQALKASGQAEIDWNLKG